MGNKKGTKTCLRQIHDSVKEGKCEVEELMYMNNLTAQMFVKGQLTRLTQDIKDVEDDGSDNQI